MPARTPTSHLVKLPLPNIFISNIDQDERFNLPIDNQIDWLGLLLKIVLFFKLLFKTGIQNKSLDSSLHLSSNGPSAPKIYVLGHIYIYL